MKNYLSNRNEISKVNMIFAMIQLMVAISYYYLINLTTDKIWVMMCGYFFLAIPAAITLIHGISAKRGDIVLLSIGFVVLGCVGFVSKLMHGLNMLTPYSYLFAATYSVSACFIFAFADKVTLGERMLSKWWFAVLMIVLSIVPTVLVYVLPENTVSLLMVVRNAVYILIYVVALALGVYGIIAKKEVAFSWAYTVYALFMSTAYIFQIFGSVAWYNTFLMLAVVTAPYVLMTAVKCKE